MTQMNRRKSSGFNLLELMVVVVIIGIIAAYGYSVYTENIIQTRRSDAKEALSRLAALQEKIFTECNAYANGPNGLTTTAVGSSCNGDAGAPQIAWSAAPPFLSAGGHYAISIVPQGPGNIGPAGGCRVLPTGTTCFLLQADPVGAGASGFQRRNGVSDGVLRIDHAGRKSWDKRLGGLLDPGNTGMYVDGAGKIIDWNAK